ncbi:myosin light chain kinase family member 4-like [Rhinophrynus dorsalis]
MEGQKSERKGAHIATEAQHSWTDPNRVTEQRACQPEHYKSTGKTGNTHSSACSNISNSLETTDPNDSMLLPRADTSAQAAEITDVTQMNQGRITKESSNRQLRDSVNHKTVFHGSDNSQEAKDKRPSLMPKIGKVQMSCIKNTKCMKSQESCEKKSVVHQKKQAEDLGKGCNETHSIIHGGKERAESQKGQLPKRESDRNLTEDQPHGSTLSDDTNTELEESSLHVIDDCPPPPAPFNHRIVSIKQAILSSCYTVCQHEVLGGGRFGQVHKCVEKASGLRLAAKIIKVKGAKDRDEVKNEITVMNQLNHVNLIQLYDAFECKNDLTLIMEYLDGGELFDRITDENYNLTELDAIMFTKQICEGIYYLHQQYILHLDLKPENILCVSQTGNQIKIIDFGLARRYKPREKLKVNFGTPEFLAPEVVNYDFVSFPTDMWSVGVITYMLLSGLSPFLGESDAETMNYIVNCSWDFDADTFEQVSDEAKDFISRLLIKEKSCRLSAGQCLKHDWLVNLPLKAKKYKVRLKSQVMLQKYMAQRKWKKHFYVVAAANRLRKFQLLSLKPT